LQLELATHFYLKTNPQADQTFYTKRSNDFYSYLNNVPRDTEKGAWGDMLARTDDGFFPKIGPDTFVNGEGPVGGPGLLPDSDSPPYNDEKSNLVGIIVSKNKFGAQDSITFTTRQYFGLPKIQQVAGGQAGGITILPIGGGIGWVGPSNPSFTYGYPQWGSNQDSYNSFGTTALHVRIFDQWPDEQTIYDGRYFGVLHFNPLPMGGPVRSNVVDNGIVFDDPSWTPASGINNVKYQRSVDQIDSVVDFRIPTYAHPTNNSIDNKPVSNGLFVTKDGLSNNQALRNPSQWRVNPIRRGQLLTKGGFRYYKRVIGVDPTLKYIATNGKNFTIGQKIVSTDKKIEIEISSTNSEGGITAFIVKDNGEGLSTTDFSGSHKIKTKDPFTGADTENTINGYKMNLSGQNGDSGSGASIVFERGVVYEKVQYDPCPLESTDGPISLTLSSNRGEKVAEGDKTTTITLSNVNNPSNKYDAFYFFHNDILHTVLSPGAFIPGFGQYVELEIGAG